MCMDDYIGIKYANTYMDKYTHIYALLYMRLIQLCDTCEIFRYRGCPGI